jgi:hypothetical protein
VLANATITTATRWPGSLQRLVWKNRTIKHPSAFAGDQEFLSRTRDAHLDAMIRHGGAGKPCDAEASLLSERITPRSKSTRSGGQTAFRPISAHGMIAVQFDLELQLLAATTSAQLLAVIEVGSAPGQSAPAPVAENLENIVWQPTPVLAQRIIVTGLKLKHHFGAAIKRSLDNVLTAERLLYATWQAASVAPASPSFVIRARLVQFDTENSVRGAKGYVFAAMTEAKAEVG